MKRKEDQDDHPKTLQHFHECDNCQAKAGNIIQAATSATGEYLMSRMSEREMAVVLTSLVLVLCEEQDNYQEDAFEDFVRHMRTVWTMSAAERRARLAGMREVDKSNLH